MTAPESRMVTPAEVATRLRSEKRVLAVTHEAPDGDALGCISAFRLVVERLGVECRAFVPGGASFPQEYEFLPKLEGVLRGNPPNVDAGTTIYMLDCASLMRSNGQMFAGGATRVNIDHHQDNPGYGELNLIDASAASTTAILYEVFKAGGFTVDADVATALYVGLVTDTGRFQFSNTTSAAHRVAADLLDTGMDMDSVHRHVYESTPLPKLRLLQRALAHLELRLGGSLVLSWIGNEDFVRAEADEGHTEGIIDTLRRIQGTRVAALIKEKRQGGSLECKVSLRSTDGTVNVAEIARKLGGGGHVRAAGFGSREDVPTLMNWLENEVRAKL